MSHEAETPGQPKSSSVEKKEFTREDVKTFFNEQRMMGGITWFERVQEKKSQWDPYLKDPVVDDKDEYGDFDDDFEEEKEPKKITKEEYDEWLRRKAVSFASTFVIFHPDALRLNDFGNTHLALAVHNYRSVSFHGVDRVRLVKPDPEHPLPKDYVRVQFREVQGDGDQIPNVGIDALMKLPLKTLDVYQGELYPTWIAEQFFELASYVPIKKNPA